ncbi:TAXI family TRAP transporter solute-binding subunit [Heyndrickxia sp. NPDC080065]|uniref:TAXI family TRAP transporter solute-binding subunit n=1 Tax=Heyndrickxia sp. NPDC080065 TaxID=3390568 RepID=UPI003D058413
MRKKRTVGLMTFLLSLMVVIAGCSGSGGKKNIAIGPPASETQTISHLILDAYGIGKDDYKAFQEGFGDAADGVQDGNIDISIGILGLPTGSIESLQAASGDVKMLSLSDKAIKHIEENSGYRRYTIPKNSYKFLKNDVETVTAYAILVANTDTIDEELGYEITKAMFDYASENTHAQAVHTTLENALKGSEGLPIHPGAKRYFEEKGLKMDNPVATVKADSTKRKKEFILGTGSQGGTYYPLGGEMANIWNKHLNGVNITNTETGASVENLATIGKGHMDLGMTVHVPALNAWEGKADFKDGKVENMAFIGHIYPEVVQIITREKTGIKSLDDLMK